MNLINLTPFPAISWENNDHFGDEFISSVVRVKFKLNFNENGNSILLPDPEQGELFGENIPFPNERELQYPSDFVPFKPHCDLILNLFSHAPQGLERIGWRCGVEVKNRSNETIHRNFLEIKPQYQYTKGKFFGNWKLSFVKSMTSLPIRYKFAYGGEYKIKNSDREESFLFCNDDNPCGTGILDKRINEPIDAPMITHLNENIPKGMAGFGAIQPSWESRFRYTGTYDEAWLNQRFPILPLDFNPLFYQSANPNMILKKYFLGGETIELISLHPLYEKISVEIPKFDFVLRQEMRTATVEYTLNIDTVIIETNEDGEWSVYICWRKRVEQDEKVSQNILFLNNKPVQF